MGLIHAIEGLNRKKRLTSLEEETILPADGLRSRIAALLWVSSLLVYPEGFVLTKLLQSCDSIS